MDMNWVEHRLVCSCLCTHIFLLNQLPGGLDVGGPPTPNSKGSAPPPPHLPGGSGGDQDQNVKVPDIFGNLPSAQNGVLESMGQIFSRKMVHLGPATVQVGGPPSHLP